MACFTEGPGATLWYESAWTSLNTVAGLGEVCTWQPTSSVIGLQMQHPNSQLDSEVPAGSWQPGQ